MKNYAYKDKEEYRCIPYVVKQDKRLKCKLRKEFKDACHIVSLVWLLSLAFMLPAFIQNQAIGTVYSLLILAVAVLQVLGW